MKECIDIKNISKTFTKVKALTDVSFKIETNQTHAIVGENGAGKSTLMKILGGVYKPDIGSISLNSKKHIFNNVKESVNAGISVIYQELNILSELSVAENIFLSHLSKISGVILNEKELYNKTEKLLSELNISLNPKTYAKNLSVSQKQMVEIARAISFNSDIIIMDEPTASLNKNEVDQLFSIIDKLRQQGKTIIYITHRMKELFEIANDVTVLRDGQYVATHKISDVTNNDIVKLMVGRKIEVFYKTSTNIKDNIILQVKDLTSDKDFEKVSVVVKEGEILGLAGLMRCGNIEFAQAIYGLNPITSGEIIFNNHKLEKKSVIDSLSKGISFVTDDRKDAGIFKLMGVKENTTITILDKLRNKFNFLLNLKNERVVFADYSDKLKLVCSGEDQKAEELSGGNQQKLLIARALASNCKLLILLEPTKGVDVGTKVEIYELLIELTKTGVGVLLVTSDLPELISISNRIAVMCQGKITGILEDSEISEEAVMRLATTA